MLVVNDKISVPLRELQFTFARSSGPGGQNVNKLNTKATLRWQVDRTKSLPVDVKNRFRQKYANRITQDGSLLITSQRFRDRGRNVADCLAKLRKMILAVSDPPKPRRPTKPTFGSKQRRRKDKQAQSRKKERRRRSPMDN